MKVKVIDEECERDLENKVNEFLTDDIDVIDIKYQTAHSIGIQLFVVYAVR